MLGQVAVTTKSNKIPAARTLLGCFDLNGAVITMDAMHTQDTARLITDASGQYVFTVKDNRPRLRAALKKLPWTDIPSHRATSTGHGRRAIRVADRADRRGDLFEREVIGQPDGRVLGSGVAVVDQYKTIADVEFATAGWVDWYNTRRLHGSLAMVSPTKYQADYYAALNREPKPA